MANTKDTEELTSAIFSLGPQVRYVAVARGQDVTLGERPELTGASSAESDRYEELLVNPALIVLGRQRGEIDCGGLRFIIVRYGNFAQVVVPHSDGGHVSVAVEPEHDPMPIAEAVIELIS